MNTESLSEANLAELLTLRKVVDNNGDTIYLNKDGYLHRINGPAVVYHTGSEKWYRNGHLHREDGPAITCPSGTNAWYRNGVIHREDGPAIAYTDGSYAWYRNGVPYVPENI